MIGLVRSIMCLSASVTALLILAGCSALNLEFSSDSSLDDRRSNHQQAKRTGGATSDDPKGSEPASDASKGEFEQASFTLSESAPNPMMASSVGGPASTRYDKLVGHQYGCGGVLVDEPAVVLNAPKDLENIEITAYRPVFWMLAVHEESGRFLCDGQPKSTENVRLNPERLDAGTWKIYIGGLSADDYVRATLRIEDQGRPLDRLWATDLETRSFDEPPSEPVALSGKTSEERDRSGSRMRRPCNRKYFGEQPEYYVQVERPIADLDLTVGSPDDVQVLLRGPITDDFRDIGYRCIEQGTNQLRKLEMGRYAVFVGTAEEETKTSWSTVWTDRDEEIDPLFQASDIPESLSLDERIVSTYFPFLKTDEPIAAEQQLLVMFRRVPRQMFVFPKFDLDDASAATVRSETEAPVFPKKNEPLLRLTEDWVMGADGAYFRVESKYLAPSPDGAIALAEDVRNNETLEHNLKVRSNADDRAAKRHVATKRRYNDCAERVWAPYESEYDALRETRNRSAAENRRMNQIEKTANAKVDRKCGTTPHRSESKYYEQLLENRAERRAEALEENNRRLETLWD